MKRTRKALLLARYVSRLGRPRRDVPRMFYCHVPKCGGTSIAQELRALYRWGYATGVFGMNLPASEKAAAVLDENMMTLREQVLAYNLAVPAHRFGTGHCYLRPRVVRAFRDDWNFVTILREPTSRLISEFVYNTHKDKDWMKNTMALEEFLASGRGRHLATSYLRYFSDIPVGHDGSVEEFVDQAVANLETFASVGLLERTGDWVADLNRKFGIGIDVPHLNKSPKSDAAAEIRANAAAMERIGELCEPDGRIYVHFAKISV